MICVHDLKGNFLIANKITLKKLGYSYEELLNLNINQIYSPKYGTLIKSEMNKLIHEEKLTFESEYLTKTGKTIPVEVISKHIIYDNKNLVLNVARDISERIKAKNKLLRFEQKYKKIPKEMELILDHLPGLIFYKEKKNNFIRVNKYLAEAHNSTKEEIAGKNNFDLYPKEQAQAYWKDDLEVIESGKPKLFIEEKWNTKNGTKWVSTSKIPFKNENNEITGIIGLSFDITNQKLIEEDLKRSKEKLKIITENANDLIYILNEHLEFEYINESVFKRKMGYSNQDLIGKSHVSKTFKKDIPTTHQKLINVFKKRNLDPIKYETREFDKGGNIHWMEINGKPFIDNDGQFKLMLIGRDITVRKKTEQKLRESEKKFRNVLENIKEGYYEMDLNGNIKSFNRTFSNLIGYNPYDCSKLNIKSFLSEIDRSFSSLIDYGTKFNFKRMLTKNDEIKINKVLNDIFLNGIGKQNIELQIEREDGSEIFVDMSIYLQKDSDGKKIGFFGFARDITERKKAEILKDKFKVKLEKKVKLRTSELNEALENQKKYLDEIVKTSHFKSKFLATMSHELRTPLNAIIGFTDLLLEEMVGELNNRQFEYIIDIKKSSEDLLQMIRQILDISHIESGKIDLTIEKIDLKKILNQIIVPLKNRYKEKNIDLKLKGVNSVKIIYADRLKIKQIFINLLDNAYKFTMEGLIQFQVKEKAKNYLFIIKDTGLGIDEKDYPKIFTDFERSSIAEINSIDGTGLGLTLTKRLIELHKGKIWFESEVSKGSIFYFTIPKPISPVEEFLKLI